MEFYEITLNAMKHLLTVCHEEDYAHILGNCLEQWRKKQDTDCFLTEFAKGGRFRTFQFKEADFVSGEQNFWVQQLFGGLVAMAIQLAGAIQENRTVDIGFIRKNFGRASEVITGTMCPECGKRQISGLDIDRYISTPIIAKRIADGLESNTLNEKIDALIDVSAPEIQRERRAAELRAANTGLLMADKPMTFCPSCGSKKKPVPCRLLKSLREPVFVPLNQ